MAFAKPVVLAHGDSHYMRMDKPYMRLQRSAAEPAIENVTRVVTFGAPHHHWLHVTVEADDPNVFSGSKLLPQTSPTTDSAFEAVGRKLTLEARCRSMRCG